MNFETVIGLEVHVEYKLKNFLTNLCPLWERAKCQYQCDRLVFPRGASCLEQGCCGRWDQGCFGPEYGYPPAHAL